MAVKTVASVRNALTILEALALAQPVGVSALARQVGIDKAAVQRALLTLGDAGWTRQSDTGEWVITSKALQVGTHYTAGLRDVSRPHLAELQRTTGETAVLFVREHASVVAVDAVESSQPLRMTVPLGMVVPLQQRSALDAFLAPAERAALPAAPDTSPNPASVAACPETLSGSTPSRSTLA